MNLQEALEILEINNEDELDKINLSKIKNIFRNLSLKYNPDRNNVNSESNEKMNQINQAYNFLRERKLKKLRIRTPNEILLEEELIELIKEYKNSLIDINNQRSLLNKLSLSLITLSCSLLFSFLTLFVYFIRKNISSNKIHLFLKSFFLSLSFTIFPFFTFIFYITYAIY